MRVGKEYVLTRPSPSNMQLFNYKRWLCILQSKGSELNAWAEPFAVYEAFILQCEEIGRLYNANRFGNPVRLVNMPAGSRVGVVTQDCFHGDEWKCVSVPDMHIEYEIPDEIQFDFTEKGYFAGMRTQVEALDKLLMAHGRRRSYMDSIVGEFYYDQKTQWSNFDIMDVISMTLIARPQLMNNKRRGKTRTCMHVYRYELRIPQLIIWLLGYYQDLSEVWTSFCVLLTNVVQYLKSRTTDMPDTTPLVQRTSNCVTALTEYGNTKSNAAKYVQGDISWLKWIEAMTGFACMCVSIIKIFIRIMCSIGMIVWQLDIIESNAGEIMQMYQLPSFEYKDHHRYWHEFVRRPVGTKSHPVFMYEMIAPLHDTAKGTVSL
jgi:hypothetical protein